MSHTWDHPNADPVRDLESMMRLAHFRNPGTDRVRYVVVPRGLYDQVGPRRAEYERRLEIIYGGTVHIVRSEVLSDKAVTFGEEV